MRKLLMFLLLAAVATARAQGPVQAPAEDDTDRARSLAEPERKRPSFWHRPEHDTPERQLEYARSLEAEGRKRRAAKEYRALVHEWHERPEAVTAQQAYSRLLEERGKFERAFEEYQYLVHYYPLRIDYDEILGRQFAVANEVMTKRRLTLFVFEGFAAPERALGMFEQIVANAPRWSRAHEAQYRVGWIREEVGDYREAAEAYTDLLHRYPDSDVTDAAGFRRAHCLYRIAKRNPRDEVACRDALSALSTYLTRYARRDENRTRAEKYLAELKSRLAKMYVKRARFYDRTGHPRAARLAYRDFVKKFPDSPMAGEAMKRIQVLGDQVEREHEDAE